MLTRRIKIPATRKTGRIIRAPAWQKPIRGVQLNRSHELARGMLACYVFNEGGGTILNDLTKNGYDGILTNFDGGDWIGGYLNFDGSNDYIPANKTEKFTDPNKFTVAVKVSGLTGARATLIGHQDLSSNWQMEVYGTSYTRLDMIISGAYIARMNLVDIRGDTGWHSVAYSRSGTGSGTHRVYHNGMEQDEETDSASNFVQPTTVPLEIGRRNPASQMFHGNVEYIYIWDRILTPQEISWIYREPYAMFSQPRRVSFLVPKYPYADRRYSRGDEEVLPSDDREMETPFVISDYSGVAADDNVYVLQTALGQYGIFRFDNYNINATDPISATCKLKSTLAPSASVVKLQILNRNTPAWEDLDTDNATAADTEFTLEGTQSSNLSYYYGDENRVSFRVYQEAV